MIDLKDLCIHHTASIEECLMKIDSNGMGIIFLVDEMVLKGVLSDGDIRRAFIGNINKKSPAIRISNKNFVSLKLGASNKKIQNTLSKRIKLIPLIDKKGVVKDFASKEKLHQYSVMDPLLGGNELEYVTECINTNWISSQGKYVVRFENNISNFLKSKYCLATSNGTVSLHLALVSLGIGNGDEVIVPNLTFGASVNSIVHAGASPVFADIDKDSWNLTARNIEPLITKKTKAIMPVHIYGNPCNMQEISTLAKKYNLLIVEDCAESIGAKVGKKFAGTFGDAATFSFFANKLITTGEGGAIIFKNKKIYEKAKILRDHGMNPKKRYWHDYVGYNYRLTNIQAAIGCAQLERIDYFAERRDQLFERYNNNLLDSGHFLNQKIDKNNKSGNWLYSLCLKDKKVSRDKLMKFLKTRGIETRPLFYPMNMMPAFKKICKFSKCPNSIDISSSGFSLPSSANLSKTDIDYISENLLSYFR